MTIKGTLIILIAAVMLLAFTVAGYAQDKATTLYMAGCKSIQDKEFTKALGLFDQALKENKTFVKAYVGRGMAQFMLNEHKKALADLNYAIERNPQNVTALFWRGSTYLMLGESKNAIPDYTAVLKQQPENAYSYLMRSICQFRLDKFEEAIADSSKAISYNPRKAEPFIVRGLCYYKQKKFDSAVRDLKKGVALEPDTAYYQLLAYSAQAMNGDKKTDDLAAFYKKMDPARGKGEIAYDAIAMMLGKKTPEEVLKAAEKFEPARLKATMVQQAQFFVSIYFTISGNNEKAAKYLDLAEKGENKLFVMAAIVKMSFYDFKGEL